MPTVVPLPTVKSLHIYPLKGAHGLSVDEATVEPWGLAGDRRWMLVDEGGRFYSQRRLPALATVQVEPTVAGGLSVSVGGPAGGTSFTVEPGECGDLVPTVLFDDDLVLREGPQDAHEWFSTVLGAPARLVHLDDPTRRPIEPGFGADGEPVSLADGYPLLLTTDGSLEALNGWLVADGEEAVPMTRFRPSVVVAPTAAWAEDDWAHITIGTVPMRVAKPCGRCIVTTVDQETGVRGTQPLPTLHRRRKLGREAIFGENLVPDATGVIHVGDEVTVRAERPSAPRPGVPVRS